MNAREIVSDLLILAGTGGAGFGIWQVYPPAAWVAVGTTAAVYGFFLGRRRQ